MKYDLNNTALESEIALEKISDGIKRIPYNLKISLCSTYFFGLLSHFYAYTNLLLSHDSSRLYFQNIYLTDEALYIVTGRPVGIIIGLLVQFLYLPWVLGFVTLSLLGISTWLICELLRIKNTPYVFLVNGVVVTFPVITSYNCYLFLAPQFALGLLFACLSVYVFIRKIKYGAAYSLLLLVLSLGSYQAFWSVSASLILLVLIGDTIDKELNNKAIISKGLSYCVILVISIITYYILWVLGMKILGLEFISYAGYDQMAVWSLRDIPYLIVYTYKQPFFFFLLLNKYSFYPIYLGLIMLINLFLCLSCCFLIVFNDNNVKLRSKYVLLIFFLLLLPFAINATYFISKGQHIQSHMMFSYLVPWFMLVLVLERIRSLDYANSAFTAKIVRVYAVSILILYSMSIYNGWIGANIAYVQLHANYESATSYITRIIYAIETSEGYEQGVQVAIIGKPSDTEPRPGFGWTKDLAGVWQSSNSLTYEKIVTDFARQIDTSIQFIVDPEIRHTNLVKNAPTYPTKGSVFWVGETLVVKLSDPVD